MNEVTTSDQVRVQINGQEQDVPAETNLVRLIDRLGLDGNRLAIEVNREIVKRDRWNEHVVQQGDAIEIVHFVGGGSCRG